MGLSRLVKDRADQMLEGPVRLLARSGLSPNLLTVAGFLLNVGVGAVLALGWEFLGGFLVLLAGLFDLLDGALARLAGRATRFGALLDSVLDRFSEAAILSGLLWLYLSRQRLAEVLLLFAVLLGSLMVSYVRARAEGLGVDCEVGLVARPERLLLLALGLILSQMVPALALLALLTHFTVAQRVWHVWRETRPRDLPGTADKDSEADRAVGASSPRPGKKGNPPLHGVI